MNIANIDASTMKNAIISTLEAKRAESINNIQQSIKSGNASATDSQRESNDE